MVKMFLLMVKILLLVVAGLILGMTWFFFSPVGPKAEEFCKMHPLGSEFDRSAALQTMASIKGGYAQEIRYDGGLISFSNGIAYLEEGANAGRVELAEILARSPHATETYVILSTGLTKRSCHVTVMAGKVTESKTWTWD